MQAGPKNHRSPGTGQKLEGQKFLSVCFFFEAGGWTAIGAALRVVAAQTIDLGQCGCWALDTAVSIHVSQYARTGNEIVPQWEPELPGVLY